MNVDISRSMAISGGKTKITVPGQFGGVEKRLLVSIPAGVVNGQKLRLKKQGMSGEPGSDLILTIRYKQTMKPLPILISLLLLVALLFLFNRTNKQSHRIDLLQNHLTLLEEGADQQSNRTDDLSDRMAEFSNRSNEIVKKMDQTNINIDKLEASVQVSNEKNTKLADEVTEQIVEMAGDKLRGEKGLSPSAQEVATFLSSDTDFLNLVSSTLAPLDGVKGDSGSD